MDWKLGAIAAVALVGAAMASEAQDAGTDGEWHTSIRKDDMTDAVICSVMPTTERMPYPMFYYQQGAGVALTAVGGDFPGRPLMIRIDTNKAESDIRSIKGDRLNRVVAQIRAGGNVMRVRAYEWPNDYPVDTEWQIDGLAQKLDECREAMKRKQ